MKTLVSLLAGGVLLFGSVALDAQAATAQNRDRNNVQNNRERHNGRNHHRRHHRRHRSRRHHEKLSY